MTAALSPSALVLAAELAYGGDLILGGGYGGATLAIYGLAGFATVVFLWHRGAADHRRQQAETESEFALTLAAARQAAQGRPAPDWLAWDVNGGEGALSPQGGYPGDPRKAVDRIFRDAFNRVKEAPASAVPAPDPAGKQPADVDRPPVDFDAVRDGMDTCVLPVVGK